MINKSNSNSDVLLISKSLSPLFTHVNNIWTLSPVEYNSAVSHIFYFYSPSLQQHQRQQRSYTGTGRIANNNVQLFQGEVYVAEIRPQSSPHRKQNAPEDNDNDNIFFCLSFLLKCSVEIGLKTTTSVRKAVLLHIIK